MEGSHDVLKIACECVWLVYATCLMQCTYVDLTSVELTLTCKKDDVWQNWWNWKLRNWTERNQFSWRSEIYFQVKKFYVEHLALAYVVVLEKIGLNPKRWGAHTVLNCNEWAVWLYAANCDNVLKTRGILCICIYDLIIKLWIVLSWYLFREKTCYAAMNAGHMHSVGVTISGIRNTVHSTVGRWAFVKLIPVIKPSSPNHLLDRNAQDSLKINTMLSKSWG